MSAKMSLAEMQSAKMLGAEILGSELSSSSKIKIQRLIVHIVIIRFYARKLGDQFVRNPIRKCRITRHLFRFKTLLNRKTQCVKKTR